VLAACSSSTTSSTAHPSTSSSKHSSVLTSAKATLAKYDKVPAFTPPSQSVDTASLHGKTVFLVGQDLNSDEISAIANGLKAAGSVIGINVVIYNGLGIPSTIDQGLQEALNDHVAAIVLAGEPASLVPTYITEAQADKIPVIGASIGNPDPSAPGQGAGPGLVALAANPYQLLGTLMADSAIVEEHGATINAAIESFDNPVATATIDGIQSVFKTCSTCHITTTIQIQPPQWTDDITPQTESLVKGNPSINVIFPVVDTMAIFATSGVKTAGAASRVDVISSDASGSAALNLVQQPGPFVSDPGGSATWVGWLAMDQAVLAMAGKPPADPAVPVRYFDKSNLSGLNVSSDSSLFGNSYVAGFEKLWGVS